MQQFVTDAFPYHKITQICCSQPVVRLNPDPHPSGQFGKLPGLLSPVELLSSLDLPRHLGEKMITKGEENFLVIKTDPTEKE